MKLYLVQHAEALPKEVDPQRHLSEKGRDDVAQLATLLERSGIKVERIIHSGKLRAQQTAEELARLLEVAKEATISDNMAPEASTEALAKEILSWQEDTLVVGHLPFMARLVSRLVVGSENDKLVLYQPGSVVCLEQSEGDKWEIAWMLRPDLLGTAS